MSENPTIQAYDRYHQVYEDETVEFWRLFPGEVIDNFVKRLPGRRVLDLGSGPGRGAVLLKEQGLDVTCLDGSSEMVKRTRELGFKSYRKDMREMKFPKNSFDGVFAYTSLIHISKAEVVQVLAELHRFLAEDGVVLVGAIEGSFEGDVDRKTMPGVQRFFRHYQEDELMKMMEEADFEFLYQQRYQPHNTVYLNQVYRKV